MADAEVCVFCGDLLSREAVTHVKKKGVETIMKCSARRNDGKDASFLGLESLKAHTNCWKAYTNERNVSVAERGTSRGRPNPAPINVPAAVPQVPGVAFSFEDHCLFCGEDISEEFKKNEKKKSVDKRIVISRITSEHTKESIVKAAQKYPMDWSTQVRFDSKRPLWLRCCTFRKLGNAKQGRIQGVAMGAPLNV